MAICSSTKQLDLSLFQIVGTTRHSEKKIDIKLFYVWVIFHYLFQPKLISTTFDNDSVFQKKSLLMQQNQPNV